jgi:hypothetical protein
MVGFTGRGVRDRIIGRIGPDVPGGRVDRLPERVVTGQRPHPGPGPVGLDDVVPVQVRIRLVLCQRPTATAGHVCSNRDSSLKRSSTCSHRLTASSVVTLPDVAVVGARAVPAVMVS